MMISVLFVRCEAAQSLYGGDVPWSTGDVDATRFGGTAGDMGQQDGPEDRADMLRLADGEQPGDSLVFPELPPADQPDAFVECEGPGCPGAPCAGNEDCDSGICTFHMGDFVCTDFCVQECPDGFSCKPLGEGPDGTYACLSLFSHLCLPCAKTADCSGSQAQNACVIYPGQGTFCGATCDAGNQCPTGYQCQDRLTTEGTTTNQCVAEEGICACTSSAVDLGLSSPCTKSNEYGVCTGLRVCTDGGLSDCDAKVPASDTCNGLDDDCDSETDEDSCEDTNPCTEDLCEPVNGCLHQPLNGTPCSDEDKCTSADICQAGECVGDPVDCKDGNPCTDDLCDETVGCTFVPNSASCEDGDPCTHGDHCQNEACVSGPYIACNDDNPCTEDLCDAVKGCVYSPLNLACDDGNPCTTGDHCDKGLCVWSELKGCDDGNICTTDGCDPEQGGCTHVPNNQPCDDQDMCTAGDKCSAGQCQSGLPVLCDDGNGCSDDSCNPLVGCIHVNNVLPCDDFDPCTQTDGCSNGICVGTGLKPCDDGNACTDDFCVPMGGCSHKPNSAPCSDGSVCTVGDHCSNGLCAPGEALVCVDSNPCTADYCDAGDGCVFAPLSEGGCDDHNECTTDDHCLVGECVSTQPVKCADDNPCTTDICLPGDGCAFVPNAHPCEDGDLCTSGDVCVESACVPGATLDCNDGNPCTSDVCAQGACTHMPLAGACDDGNPCTEQDQCVDGNCAAQVATDCDDENLCTLDYCDPGLGCVHLLNDAPCDDGDVCTSGDQCGLGACEGGVAINCNDGNPCTDDSCDPVGGCLFAPNNGGQCSDGNACTLGDHCAGGICVVLSFDACDDQELCTADSCDPAQGCQHVPLVAPCNDGDECTIDDACVDGGCLGGAPADCDDDQPCTEDSCDQLAGCQHDALPDTTLCDDQDQCTENDECSQGECGGDQVECDDGNVCTDDSCEPADGCVNEPVPDGAPCDDGDACNVTDTCQDGACVGSGNQDCDDQDECTEDSCDVDQGCLHDPITPCCGNGDVEAGEQCDDGNGNSGDGCSDTCQNESPCPVGTAYVLNYCWVKAIVWNESHGAACSRIGRTPTAKEVPMNWNNSVLTEVAAVWGYSSVGDYSDAAMAMWCNPGSQTCGTHNWGSTFNNYGTYGDNSWWPVYICHP